MINTITRNLYGLQNSIENKIIYVGMSGGVDSSLTAVLLQQGGADVRGVYLNCWGDYKGCSSRQDYQDALKVASKFNIPLYIWDFKDEYEKTVLEPFIADYEAGLTPNPDVLCNKQIKFDAFLHKVLDEENSAYLATGHYARVLPKSSQGQQKRSVLEKGKFSSDLFNYIKVNNILLSGLDLSKDQSYFLYQIILNTMLHRVIFPIGGLKKAQTRELAKQLDIPTHSKPDSQGICFIGDVNIREFLSERINVKQGEVVNSTGEVIGNHSGVQFYTIGQRHGFNINVYTGVPLYVIDKDIGNNRLIVGERDTIYTENIDIKDLELIIDSEVLFSADLNGLKIRIRNLGELHQVSEIQKITENLINVKLVTKIFGAAPGQSAVFYLDDVVLGGGLITKPQK